MTTPISPEFARMLACMLALGATPSVRAQEPEEAEEEETPAPQTDAALTPPWKSRFGAVLDVGAPTGVGVSGLVHPLRWLRVHLGATRNTLGFGVRGGTTVIPLELFVSPTLDLEVGHVFKADYNKLLSQWKGQPVTSATNLREVGYSYGSASLGLQFSPSAYVTLFGGVGISAWSFRVDEARDFIREAEGNPDITAKPVTLNLTSPALKLGLLVSFD
jgi:hypothetical protein